MAQVGKVQPAPIPMKTIPAAGFTCTHTADLWVSVTPRVTRKPMQVCHFFIDLSCFFVFSFFKNIIFVYFLVLYLLYNTVTM